MSNLFLTDGMKERLFKFKNFSVAHSKSAMKVGVDGVLIGAWADTEGESILDAGTGCGLIALMMAQRNANAKIIGIDMDKDSVEEAKWNVKNSQWGNRIEIKLQSFNEFIIQETPKEKKFDLIVSNPPFFDSGVSAPFTSRERARHQGPLSPISLIRNGKKILSENGRIALIAPSEMIERIKATVKEEGMTIKRICFVAHHPGAVFKRIMVEIINNMEVGSNVIGVEELIMFQQAGEPTESYRQLCQEFYLHF